MKNDIFLNSMAIAGSSGNALNVFNKELMTSNVTTAQPDIKPQGYVEWYWVILGLVLPILLGSLFCILDHFRRRNRSRRYTERRLERICERNKVEPPSYESSAVRTNECITITDNPNAPSFSNSMPSVSLSDNTSTIIQVLPQTTISHVHINMETATQNSETESSVNEGAIDSFESVSVSRFPSDSESTQADDQASSSLDYAAQDPPENLDAINLKEGPPSYEEYHLYEVYGSTTQLV